MLTDETSELTTTLAKAHSSSSNLSLFYPNPVKAGNALSISQVDRKVPYAELRDLFGKLIQAEGINATDNYIIRLNNHTPTGAYILTLTDGEGKKFSGRVVVE